MDVTSHCSTGSESGASKTTNQSECISNQPAANGALQHDNTDEAPPLTSDRMENRDSGDVSLTDSSSPNDLARVLPACHSSAAPLRIQTGVEPSVARPPIFTPTSSHLTSPPPPVSSRHTCNLPHHHSTNQKCLSSTERHASIKTDAAHIKQIAGDDCCVHCLLACLFCKLQSMCSALGACLVCGEGGAECCDAVTGCCCCCCCCCVEAACTEQTCQALLDCGILEDCCSSADCLEICMECCSICFPS